MSLVRDEKGKLSSSRTSFWTVLVVGLLLITTEFFTGYELSNGAYGFMVAALIATASWAGGRAVAQYIGPALAGAVAGLRGRTPSVAQRPPEDIEP